MKIMNTRCNDFSSYHISYVCSCILSKPRSLLQRYSQKYQFKYIYEGYCPLNGRKRRSRCIVMMIWWQLKWALFCMAYHG